MTSPNQQTALPHTKKRIPGILGDRRPEHAVAAAAASRLTDGVRAFAKEKGMDITTEKGWTTAFDAARTARPNLFAK